MANELLEYRVFMDGEHLFDEGSRGGEAYVIQDGKVRILRFLEDSDDQIGVRGPRDIVGEMAIISDMPRMATAVSVGETYCRVISRQLFRQLVDNADVETQSLIHFLVNFLRHVEPDPDQDEDAGERAARTKRIMVARHLVDSEETKSQLERLEPFFSNLCRLLCHRVRERLDSHVAAPRP